MAKLIQTNKNLIKQKAMNCINYFLNKIKKRKVINYLSFDKFQNKMVVLQKIDTKKNKQTKILINYHVLFLFFS